MVHGDGVDAVEHLHVEDEGTGGEGEEERDHQPGAMEVGGQGYSAEADGEAHCDDTQRDESAELRHLSATGFGEINFFGSRDGAEVADCPVGEGGEEEPTKRRQADED